ncbi:G-protein coupled receptor Mth2-like isoform X3 [Metopolophium dirhodum]|uniref:G-protein coupled receptor Mth2-like isoform X3 n=1 Tax=Metopolophium dirhodum TaxID=44670 RepID=UPI0029903007|nr:G-protein coupled receptor Mth2-like isoform X3 [Metopolophium dirhodum]
MNTVRLCFAATAVAYLVVAIDWSAADAVVCCNSSSVTSGSGVAFCQNENRTFHMVEAIGGGTCDDNRTALPVRKCCPPGQLYDPEMRFCRPAGADDDEYLRRMMQRLRDGFRVVADAVMVGYDYEQPMCDAKQVLVDVPAVEVRGLMEAEPSAIELPPDYCFDMTPTDELVARTCRLRDQYCGRDGYTCVNKCCKCDQMYVIDDDGRKCKQSEKPFTIFAYETDADGRPVGQSNSTVLPYNIEPRCFTKQMDEDGFTLTTDGSLYLTGDVQRIPETEYCVEYYAKAGAQVVAVLQAFVCGKDTRDSWVYKFIRASDVASVVCLVLTLLVYNTLPSLQNSRNYYVKFYMACELVSSTMYASQWITEDLKGHTCVLYGYFTLFAVLTSICWLNVICFDIYWMLRFVMSIKLFLIMGTSYFFWIICSLFQIYEGIIWDFSDAMTSLQGVIVFIIFVAKRKVIMDLRNKFRGSMDHSESTQINTISGSS